MTTVRVIDAPSNLGLRPPAPGRQPGTATAPAAPRSAGLLAALEATEAWVVDGGSVPAPPYDHAEWRRDDDGVRHAKQLAEYALQLAAVVDDARCGLVFVDGHSDFRHPGNVADAGPVGAAAGEDLALVIGHGQDDPDGPLPDDRVDLIAGLLRTGRCLGVEATVFNPTQDPDGTQSRRLVDVLARASAGGRAAP